MGKKSGILLLRSFLPISQVVLRGTGKGSISQSGEEDEELFFLRQNLRQYGEERETRQAMMGFVEFPLSASRSGS